MNLDNLREGMRLKSYKELCNALGDKVKGGASKIAHLKELSRYVDYTKDGNAFIIQKIYNDVLPKKDKRLIGGYDEIGILLLFMGASLASVNKNSTVLSTTQLLSKFNMINSNYSLARKNQNSLSKVLDIPKEVVNDFFNTTHDNLKRRIETNLDKLKTKRQVDYYKVKMVSENGYDFSEATDEERYIILEAEKSALNTLGYRNIRGVFTNGVSKSFYKLVSEELSVNSNIKFYYSGYKIIYNKKFILDELENIFNREELEEILNKKVIDNIINNANNRHNKALLDNKLNNIRSDESYINNIELIALTCIDSLAEDIKNEIYNYIEG